MRVSTVSLLAVFAALGLACSDGVNPASVVSGGKSVDYRFCGGAYQVNPPSMSLTSGGTYPSTRVAGLDYGLDFNSDGGCEFIINDRVTDMHVGYVDAQGQFHASGSVARVDPTDCYFTHGTGPGDLHGRETGCHALVTGVSPGTAILRLCETFPERETLPWDYQLCRNATITVTPAPPTYTAAITGSQLLYNGDTGSWGITTSLPDVPSTCVWWMDAAVVQSGGCNLQLTFSDGPGYHTLYVSVTDASGNSASSNGFGVTVNSCPGCDNYRPPMAGSPIETPKQWKTTTAPTKKKR